MRRMRELCTLRPHTGDAKELEVVDAMDAEDHGESIPLLFRVPTFIRKKQHSAFSSGSVTKIVHKAR